MCVGGGDGVGGRVLSGAISCGCFVMWFSDNPKSVSTQVRTYVLKLQRCFFVGAVSESSGGQSRGMQDIPLRTKAEAEVCTTPLSRAEAAPCNTVSID